jgi:hypothetical protein
MTADIGNSKDKHADGDNDDGSLGDKIATSLGRK